MAMQKAIDKERKNTISHQVNNVLNTHNKLSIKSVYNLLLNLLILVSCKKNVGQLREYKRFYNYFLNIQSKLVVIKLLQNPTKFKNTLIKPYFLNNIFINDH